MGVTSSVPHPASTSAASNEAGNYETAIQGYKAAALSLFPSLFKQFVVRRIEPKIPEPNDVGVIPVNPPFSISPTPVQVELEDFE